MKSQRLLLPLLALAALVHPPAAQDGAQGEAGVPRPKVLGVDITFLANAGFFLQSGRYSVLIDAFLREPFELYAGLPDEVYKQLVNAQPPFDKLTVVLVSHNHPDHVQLRGLEKYLGKNNQAQLMTSPQVILALQAHARDFASIQRRLSPIPTVVGSINTLLQEEMSIGLFELEHGGKLDEKLVNLGHLIEMGGLKILHVGDAKPSLENFAAYDLDERAIDIAIVPYWFFNQASGVRVLQEQIKARTVIVCHVPPSELEKFDQLLKAQFPEVVLFRSAMEKRSFLPEGAKPAGGEGR